MESATSTTAGSVPSGPESSRSPVPAKEPVCMSIQACQPATSAPEARAPPMRRTRSRAWGAAPDSQDTETVPALDQELVGKRSDTEAPVS